LITVVIEGLAGKCQYSPRMLRNCILLVITESYAVGHLVKLVVNVS